MPRFLVTGTRPDAPGIHEVRVEADSREEAARFVAERHGLHILDVTYIGGAQPADSEAVSGRPIATPPTGQRIVREIAESDEPHVVVAAIGCLWLTIIVTLIATVVLFFVLMDRRGDSAAWLIFATGLLSLAVPLALIAIIELLRRILRRLPRNA